VQNQLVIATALVQRTGTNAPDHVAPLEASADRCLLAEKGGPRQSTYRSLPMARFIFTQTSLSLRPTVWRSLTNCWRRRTWRQHLDWILTQWTGGRLCDFLMRGQQKKCARLYCA